MAFLGSGNFPGMGNTAAINKTPPIKIKNNWDAKDTRIYIYLPCNFIFYNKYINSFFYWHYRKEMWKGFEEFLKGNYHPDSKRSKVQTDSDTEVLFNDN